MKSKVLLPRLAAILALFVGPAAHAAESASTIEGPERAGTIEGRVQDITKGDYLNNARVRIEGTNLTTLTNEFGEYRLSGVPAGEAKVTAFYSGLPAQTATVNVTAGQRAVRDFDLKSRDVVQLSALTVTAERMERAEIATHEQRYSPNLKSVFSADTFGEQSENNIGEFLKLMPGIQIEYTGQDARQASIRGMPTQMTIVTADGNQLASASSGQTQRAFEFEQISINDVERVEVFKTLLPDQPAEGIGGTINLVWKSAFERSRPSLNYRGYLNFNSTMPTLGKTPGPGNKDTFKTRPGFDFTYVNPLTKNFGFTVSGAYSQKYNPDAATLGTHQWNLDAATGGTNPFLRNVTFYDTPKITDRTSGRISFDWRFAPHDVISVGFSEAYYVAPLATRRLNTNVGTNPTAWSRDFVQGRTGAGRVGFTNSFNEKAGTTWTPEFKHRHNGPVWKFEAGGAYSHATSNYRDFPKSPRFSSGTFEVGSINPTTGVGRQAPTVRFDNTATRHVPDLTVVLQTGETVDGRDVRNGIIGDVGSLNRKAADVKKTFRLSATRDVNIGIPLTVKAGGDFRNSIRDIQNFSRRWFFVGPDGIRSSLDDRASLYDIIDDRYTTPANIRFGTSAYVWPSMYKLYDLYVQHPENWSEDKTFELTRRVTDSRYLDEKITSGYLRIDGALFGNRLRFAGGVRHQRYKLHSEGPLTNALGKYLYDENDELVLGPDGNPVAGSGDSDEVFARTNVERGLVREGRVKDFYPSLTVKYALLQNLELSGSIAETINYPVLGDLTPASSISDYTAANPQVTANAALDPWEARNSDIDLAYYTPTGGNFTLSLFRRDITGFIEQITYDAGTPEAKAELEAAGYGVLYDLDYRIRIRRNSDKPVHLKGWEFALRQNLDAYVPGWARGATVFFNTSYTSRPKGAAAGAISNRSSRIINWGANYRRDRLGLNLKWNHVPQWKLAAPTSGTVRNSKTYLDVDVTYRILKQTSVFFSATNITRVLTEVYENLEFGNNANLPDYAHLRGRSDFGVQCIVGIKGNF